MSLQAHLKTLPLKRKGLENEFGLKKNKTKKTYSSLHACASMTQ